MGKGFTVRPSIDISPAPCSIKRYTELHATLLVTVFVTQSQGDGDLTLVSKQDAEREDAF